MTSAEKITTNSPNLMKDISLYIWEGQQSQNRVNSKKTMPRHIIITLLRIKDKNKILKTVSEKWHITYKTMNQMTTETALEVEVIMAV